MKAVLATMLVALACAACSGDAGDAKSTPFKRLPKADLRVFGCSASPTHLVFTSEAELNSRLDEAESACPPADATALRVAFLDSMGRTPVIWERDALVVVQEYYGTGMAKARLDLALAAADEVKATIVWTVPPPPVTPDTVVYRFAFTVKKAVVRKVRVSGREPTETVLDIAR